jgi:hypothetical protein
MQNIMKNEKKFSKNSFKSDGAFQRMKGSIIEQPSGRGGSIIE